MKQLQNLRDAIIRAHTRGKKQNEIADFLGISQGTVSRTIKRYEETGSNDNRKREKTARTPENIQLAEKRSGKIYRPKQLQRENWRKS